MIKKLRNDAEAIWRAGVEAAGAEVVTANAVRANRDTWKFGPYSVDPQSFDRLVIVGGGKAADGMVRGVLQAIKGLEIATLGWVNVPDECAAELGSVRLHGGRPWGTNEPTQAAVVGTREMLNLVNGLCSRDLCLCLLTGGGSALIAAPPPGVLLEEKISLTRQLVTAGASIQELNAVRRCLSDVKGGGLAAACRAGQMITLLISDVLGDELSAIASGPTVIHSRDPAAAKQVVAKYLTQDALPPSIRRVLDEAHHVQSFEHAPAVQHVVVANIDTAIEGAAREASARGYRVDIEPLEHPQPEVDALGQRLAQQLTNPPSLDGPMCRISGGEPSMKLVEIDQRGRGGRNQQLVLAALQSCLQTEARCEGKPWPQLQKKFSHAILLSAGTDGEDGPTDAAGAFLDAEILDRTVAEELEPRTFLATNDAYSFFKKTGGLIKTGWTGTNVCDLRILLRL